PSVIKALGNTLAPAQLCNAVLAAQSIEHNPDLVLGRKVPSARPSDILDHLLGGLLRLRGFRRHSGSFVFQTRPELSLNLKPNSVPRALMPDRPSYIAQDLADYIRANGMDHVRGAPLHPQTQGKIERWHQTLKNRVLLENYFLP